MADAKTIPVTDEMTEAGAEAADGHFAIDGDAGPWLRAEGFAAAYRAMAAAAPQPAASDVPHDVVRALEALSKAADRYHDATAHYFSDGDYDADGQLADTSAELTVIALPQALAALATPAPYTSTEEALRAENARLREAAQAVLAYTTLDDLLDMAASGEKSRNSVFGIRFGDLLALRSALSR